MALILITFHVQELREEVENWGGQARELQRVSRREVADLPPDTQVGVLSHSDADPWHFGTDADPRIHASLWLMDLDPDPAIFVIDIQDDNKKTNFWKSFSAYYFLKVHLHSFSRIICQKEVTKQ